MNPVAKCLWSQAILVDVETTYGNLFAATPVTIDSDEGIKSVSDSSHK